MQQDNEKPKESASVETEGQNSSRNLPAETQQTEGQNSSQNPPAEGP